MGDNSSEVRLGGEMRYLRWIVRKGSNLTILLLSHIPAHSCSIFLPPQARDQGHSAGEQHVQNGCSPQHGGAQSYTPPPGPATAPAAASV